MYRRREDSEQRSYQYHTSLIRVKAPSVGSADSEGTIPKPYNANQCNESVIQCNERLGAADPTHNINKCFIYYRASPCTIHTNHSAVYHAQQ